MDCYYLIFLSVGNPENILSKMRMLSGVKHSLFIFLTFNLPSVKNRVLSHS